MVGILVGTLVGIQVGTLVGIGLYVDDASSSRCVLAVLWLTVRSTVHQVAQP